MYIDALPITHLEGRYALKGSGETVEFAVKMRQLAETDSMKQCLECAALNDADIEALGGLLVGFYAQAAVDSQLGTADTVDWEENLHSRGYRKGSIRDEAIGLG